MKRRFQWDLYEEAHYNLSFLANDPYKSILQLVGCNREGMSLNRITQTCKIQFTTPGLMEQAVEELCKQGLMSKHLVRIELIQHIKEREYFKVNWEVLKQINNVLKRLP